jgi:uncharacterized protein (DUF2062 family)
VTAALFGAMLAAALGGVGTIIVALLWMKLFPALRVTPAMESGIADHVWSLEEIANLLD